MSGGGSGSKSQSSSGTPKFARNIMLSQWKVAKPVLATLGSQILEALQTGGVNARIPIVQRVVEAGRKATADTMMQTNEGLARAGITGPFAQGVKAQTQQQGEFDVSQIATQVIQALLGQAQNFGYMQGSPVFGGISPTAKSSSFSVSQWGGMGNSSGGSSSCYIALELYGPTLEFVFAWWWINFGWQGLVADMCRWLYRLFGKRWVRVIQRHELPRSVTRLVFDIAVVRGRSSLC